MANFICNNQGFVRADESVEGRFCSGAWEALGYEIDEIDRIIERAREAAAATEHYLPGL